MNFYFAIVDDNEKADYFSVQAYSGDCLLSTYTITVDKEKGDSL